MPSRVFLPFRLCVVVAAVAASAASLGARQTGPSWTQWGGPTRDFMVPSTGLANAWPPGGPRRLWSRALGEGHSAILVENGRLYTQYRPVAAAGRSQEEVVTALDAATGSTIWEHRYASPTTGTDYSEGAGPHATALVAGNKLVVVGSRREFMALDKNSGKVLWSHDLIKEYRAPGVDRGMANSPLLFNNTIFLPIGDRGQALGAFNPDTGALLWKSGHVTYSPASPTVIDVDGQKQIVLFGGDRIAGIDPANGTELWNHPHRTDWGLNISTPVWDPAAHLLLFSSAYGTGSRALELRQHSGKTAVRELWAVSRVRVHIGTIIRVGDTAYLSSGDFGPAFLTAVNTKTGAIAWQDRAFARAQLLYADNKLIILDEDGTLAIASVSPQGLKVLSRASILEHRAWTPPTLAGRTLYVRDRKTIAAYDLG
ncbi:MAG TPA: PQQ-binding-like beta-propeller repeat protein [Vicinamibacterales bacterium]|nr:PQQ-binding-like beta-propeller repeat protein [Vicinamibacterales bacterium]